MNRIKIPLSEIMCRKFQFWLYQSKRLEVATIWSTRRLDTKLMALPPVGDELLVKVQLEKDAVFTTRTAS